jgi:hypothetical protein
MARLPKVGGDDNTWGGVLNDFLTQEHNPDGTLKSVVRPSDSRLSDTRTPTDGSVTDAKIVSGGLSPTSIKGVTALSGSNTGDQTKASLGLDQIDNTSDANKPLSTAQSAALAQKEKLLFPTTPLPFGPSTGNKAAGDNAYAVKCIDLVDNRLICADSGTGACKQSTDWGATWSNNKTLPPNVLYSGLHYGVRFGGYLYFVCLDNVDGFTKVYRTPPAAGNTAFTWTLVLTFVSGAIDLLGITADASYIYAAEYGAPVGGPNLYRSATGDLGDWTTLNFATDTHIHCIETDPYNPGHIWLTGNGNTISINYSTDYGATWTRVPARFGRNPTAVGITFSPDWVYCGGDGENCSVIAIDKATRTWNYACKNAHFNVAVPGGGTNIFSEGGFYILVDPATEIIYLGAPSGTGKTAGLFYLAERGGRIELLTYGESVGKMWIANGILFFHGWHRKPFTYEAVS